MFSTDSTEIFISKLRSAGFSYNLPSFFTESFCAGGIFEPVLTKPIKKVCMPNNDRRGTKIIKHFSCATQMSMKFIMFIDIKMPKDSLWHFNFYKQFSMLHTTYESMKA